MQELNKPKNSQSYPNSCQAPLVLSPSFMNLMLTAITYRNFNGKMEVGPHCLWNETYRDTIVGSDGKFSSFFSMAWCPKGSLFILLTAFSSVFNLHRWPSVVSAFSSFLFLSHSHLPSPSSSSRHILQYISVSYSTALHNWSPFLQPQLILWTSHHWSSVCLCPPPPSSPLHLISFFFGWKKISVHKKKKKDCWKKDRGQNCSWRKRNRSCWKTVITHLWKSEMKWAFPSDAICQLSHEKPTHSHIIQI